MQQDTATISRPASPSNDTTTTTTTDPLLPLYLDAIAKAQAHVLRTGIVDLPTPSPTMPRVVGRVVPSGGGGNDVAVYMPAPFARDRSAVLVLQQPAPGSGSGACVWGMYCGSIETHIHECTDSAVVILFWGLTHLHNQHTTDAHHHAVPDRHSLEVLAAHHCFPGRYHQRLLVRTCGRPSVHTYVDK